MTLLTIMIILALIATLASLAWGLSSMAHGGSYDKEHSEMIMFTRVGIQAAAVALIVLAVFLTLA